jgi:rubredoxin
MKRWRCTNCRHDFKAAAAPGSSPACPECGISPADHPRFASLIIELKTVHFDPPSRVKGIGLNRPACKPKAPLGSLFGNGMGSGEPTDVNCEACRATKEWQDAMDFRNGIEPFIPGEHDEALTPKTAAENEADAEAAARLS